MTLRIPIGRVPHHTRPSRARVCRVTPFLLLTVLLLPRWHSDAAEVAGVMVRLEEYAGPATVAAQPVALHKLALDVDPKGERDALVIRIDLPVTGRDAWPAADVEVLDAEGRALSVRRSGIEWHKLLIPVPAARATYRVHASKQPGGVGPALPESARSLTDAATGLTVRIARWPDGRQAALSIRFDDSHPSHLSKAVPILRRYGFRGTFMVNPGGADFQAHRAEWEACAHQGDQEFANHSMHHRGAEGDDEMEREIGDAADAIRRILPRKSSLMALNLGGGTLWETTRPLRYYLDTYHLFDASQNSTGMDDTYGDRVETFRRTLERHLERGLWCRVHYHSIGDGLAASEPNFRAALDVAKEHEAALWVAGMADIHKYQSERGGASLVLVASAPRRLSFTLSCATDPDLYDQPLTIEVNGPDGLDLARVQVTDAQGRVCATRAAPAGAGRVFRFEVPPRTAAYTVTLP